MKCPICGGAVYGEPKICLRCGYSEAQVKRELKQKMRSVSISKNQVINQIYWKLFGHADARAAKRMFGYSAIILVLIFIPLHFFLYVDVSHGCVIPIKPSFLELSNTTMKKGLKYLKKNFPAQYKDTCEHVKVINPNMGCGGFGGGCFYHNSPGEITVSTTYGNYINAAKVIIHETCHAVQYNEGRPGSEPECYEKDAVIPWKYPDR